MTTSASSIAAWLRDNADLPRIDREVLLADVLERTRAYVFAHPERLLANDDLRRLDDAASQLRQGTPIAYVRGWREFFGHRFRVSPYVLVPRPETELLVELCVREARTGERVLDLGTGSGAIAISVGIARPDLAVTAIDISAHALDVARDNARTLGASITFAQGCWFEAVTTPHDIVVANPPYIADGDPALATLGAEPRLALTAGADGLDAIRVIVRQAPSFCRRLLMLEHGADQGAAVRELLAAAGMTGIRTETDLAGHDRITWGRLA
ncbi:MAG: peptide chain release factor N(5)-glutamine methyltransferase [Pseudomonadales bacterium]